MEKHGATFGAEVREAGAARASFVHCHRNTMPGLAARGWRLIIRPDTQLMHAFDTVLDAADVALAKS